MILSKSVCNSHSRVMIHRFNPTTGEEYYAYFTKESIKKII